MGIIFITEWQGPFDAIFSEELILRINIGRSCVNKVKDGYIIKRAGSTICLRIT